MQTRQLRIRGQAPKKPPKPTGAVTTYDDNGFLGRYRLERIVADDLVAKEAVAGMRLPASAKALIAFIDKGSLFDVYRDMLGGPEFIVMHHAMDKFARNGLWSIMLPASRIDGLRTEARPVGAPDTH